MLKLAILMLFTALSLGLPLQASAAGTYQQPERQGFFGTVALVSEDHPRAVSGETDITLDTAEGPVVLTATVATVVRIPGWESASLDSIAVGDPVAVLALEGRATSILVRTALPVRTRHFTGVVTSVDDDGTVGLESREGDHLSALALGNIQHLSLGEMATAVVEQDLTTGSLLVTGLDRAIDSLDRVQSALDLAQRSGASANLEALRQRLVENGTRHITTLQEASQGLAPSLRGRVRQELESTVGAYASAFARSGAGKPLAEVAGIITAIDDQSRLVTVAPSGLEPVEVAITGDTFIQFQGRQGRFDHLDLASRVRVRYDVEDMSASRVLVLPAETLKRELADALLSVVQRGETSGTVTGVSPDANPPTVTVADPATGGALDLTVSAESVILAGGVPADIASLPGASVAASFDPESLSIIELDTLSIGPAEATVSGVVDSFISKAVPGNLSILTPEGEVLTLNRTEETVIRRDGRRVTVSQVRLGDLVRPNTLYRAEAGGTLVLLSLKSPGSVPVHGTIRGVTTLPDGGTSVTLSNNWLEITSLLVTDDTQLVRQGKAMAVGDLALGQRVLTGVYDPFSKEASRLVVEPPKAVQIKGEVTAVDRDQRAITITPRRGEPVRLLVPESSAARIVLRGNPDAGFGDLQAGQQVRAGFYDAGSMEALRLVVN